MVTTIQSVGVFVGGLGISTVSGVCTMYVIRRSMELAAEQVATFDFGIPEETVKDMFIRMCGITGLSSVAIYYFVEWYLGREQGSVAVKT